jgi:hypothetical protein
MVTGGQIGQIPEIDPRNAEATSAHVATSFMGFTILIVRRQGIILCNGWSPGLRSETWATH